ncbi:Carboxypeptidase B2 [Acropora cervicornis]|uniref:Carboxypeptidase B2 n=1 Tax=Acropora cervicornis TaxID=6130 RepID=A0AAD9VEN7_ACRCE|nr:Carboxypeptidase B2 [Acropora cervicornis]
MRESWVSISLPTVIIVTVVLLLKCNNSMEVYHHGHKVVRVTPKTKKQLGFSLSLRHQFTNKNLEFWRIPSRKGAVADISIAPRNIYDNITQQLLTQDVKFKVRKSQLESVIDEQDFKADRKSGTHAWFERCHTLEQIFSWLQKKATQCKGRCQLLSIGKSFQERRLYAMKVQTNRQAPKPLVFITCGIHAREWVSPATCMYLIEQLIADDSNDVALERIINKVDFLILPVFNPDGYIYTWEKDRMWRKNRGVNPNSDCVGTDLNRNWSFHWGETGASSDPCSPAYRGRAAMSEVEVQSVAKFLESQRDRLVGYLDIHSYGQMILFPWGYTRDPADDQKELIRVAKAMAKAIKTKGGYHTNYTFGQASRTVYIESGTTKDYVYGHLNVKYVFSLELRDLGKYGFILPSRLVEPTVKEAFEGIKAMVMNMKLKIDFRLMQNQSIYS